MASLLISLEKNDLNRMTQSRLKLNGYSRSESDKHGLDDMVEFISIEQLMVEERHGNSKRVLRWCY